MNDWIEYAGDLSPVPDEYLVEVQRENGRYDISKAGVIAWRNVVAYRVMDSTSAKTIKAPDVLAAAAKHMADRAATYDASGKEERSMDAAVKAFNALCRRDLSESEGWVLLACLKASRLFQRPGFHQDSAEDLVAYCALLAESKSKEQA